MPNITPYQAPQNLGFQPSETGVEAVAGAARRLGAFGNQRADAYNQEGQELKGAVADAGAVAVDYMDHREISAGAATFAKLQDNLTQQWNATAKTADHAVGRQNEGRERKDNGDRFRRHALICLA